MFAEEMKPRTLNRMLAHTSAISGILGVCIAIGFFLWLMFEESALTSDSWTILWVGTGMIPIGVAGWIVGIIILWWHVLGPIAAKLQGWPFRVGENVLILTGNRKGTTARVCEIWTERGQVVLDLGDRAEPTNKTVYCAVSVCSENKSTEQIVRADTGERA